MKQISLCAETFASGDEKGSMGSDQATAHPHNQHLNDGKCKFLMQMVALAVPEMMLGEYMWLV